MGNIQIVADHDHGGWIDWIKSDSGNNDARGRIRYGTHSGGGMQFFTETTERMRITNTGNVGIGTTSPSQKLEVNGNILINNGTSVGGTGGKLIFDSGYNTSGPNKINYLSNGDNRFGIGVFFR